MAIFVYTELIPNDDDDDYDDDLMKSSQVEIIHFSPDEFEQLLEIQKEMDDLCDTDEVDQLNGEHKHILLIARFTLLARIQ